MVKFELLSQNLYTILSTLASNQNVAKYLTYEQDNPLSNPDVANPLDLIRTRIFPYPFSVTAKTDQHTQINIFYERSKITNRVIQDVRIIFDIVCHKNLWLLNDGSPSFRPYKIATEIMKTFDEVELATVGVLRFQGFNYLIINDDFHAISLTAQMLEAGSSQPKW